LIICTRLQDLLNKEEIQDRHTLSHTYLMDTLQMMSNQR